MKIKGLTLAQIENCAREAGHFGLRNVRSIGNYHFFVLRMASATPRHCGVEEPLSYGRGYRCTRPTGHEGEHWTRDEKRVIRARWHGGRDNPDMRYRKRAIGRMLWGSGPHYGIAVCFHGFRAFMRKVFEVNPNAIIRTAKAAYLGAEDFEAKWPAVGHSNVGSQMCPVAYEECCDC